MEINNISHLDYIVSGISIRDIALGDSILIGRIFLRIIEELEAKNIKDIEYIDPVVVKRFQIRPLV